MVTAGSVRFEGRLLAIMAMRMERLGSISETYLKLVMDKKRPPFLTVVSV
jgi:hypothetical protein